MRTDRRRFLTIAAAVAGLPLLARAGLPAQGAPAPLVWRGQALGAPTQMIVNHPDPARAAALADTVAAELRRLEAIFSLYRADSELSALNRTGALAAPSPEMVAALDLAGQAHAITGGRFDPTVQPLWRALASGADAGSIAQARAAIGFDRVHVGAARIAMPRGMALTLNGIAQGIVTDRISDLLIEGGSRHTLVDMGEIRAIDGRPDGTPWRVTAVGGDVDLAGRAIATTEAAGYSFDADGRLPHLIDPARGAPRAEWAHLCVVAPQAGLADALSTGFALAPAPAITAALARLPGVQVRAVAADGRSRQWG